MNSRNPGYKAWLDALKPGDVVESVVFPYRGYNQPTRMVRSLTVVRRTAARIMLARAKCAGPFDEVQVRAADGMIIGASSGMREHLCQAGEAELAVVRREVWDFAKAAELSQLKWRELTHEELVRVDGLLNEIRRLRDEANTAAQAGAAPSPVPTPAAGDDRPTAADCGGAQHAAS